ncbi:MULTISPECIES: MBL fold metallo-hydrolase [unclassified Arthrobacter]|uniref:MBL fold metallo-hydrolase n=1 Tax=unclassified Arthrobacter TaxID=235627 RepID=UPI0021575AD8|nr:MULTISPECIES: MBL fold metallo-hydrolase [unclassified Arthrobacter]
MCEILGRAAAAGIGRRAMLASLGLGAAAAGLGAMAGPARATDPARREFGPAPAGSSNTRLVLLGTSGGPPYWPGGSREGISTALVVGDRYYIIDAGHGVMGQLRKARLGINYETDMDGPLDALGGIFLTHLHSDHVADLNNILSEGIFNGLQHVEKKVPIWGPGNRGELPELFGGGKAPKPLNPRNPTPGTKQMTDLLVQAFATDFNDRLFDNRKPRPDELWEAFDVPVPKEYMKNPNSDPCPAMEPFDFFEDDRIKVSAILANHAPVFPSLAYRFETEEGSVVFSGDTGLTPNITTLAQGADVLVHEVLDKTWPESLFPQPRSDAQEGLYQHLIQAHTLIEDVGKVAQAANVGTLVLSHLVPGNRPDEVWARCAEDFDGKLVIGRDLDVIGVGTQ